MALSPPAHAPTPQQHGGPASRGDDGHEATPRIIGGRSSLPGPRAVMGGLLVTVAALGTFLAAGGSSAEAGDDWVVAARPVDQGARLGPDDLTVARLTLDEGVATESYADVDALVGSVALAPLRPGSLIQSSQVVSAEMADVDGAATGHEVALRLPRAQVVDGAVNRGERVDVLATYGSGTEAVTLVVARDALVLRIGAEQAAGLGSDGGLTLTVQVPEADTVLRLVHAKDVATVTMVRATLADAAVEEAPLDRYAGPERDGDGSSAPAGLTGTSAGGPGDAPAGSGGPDGPGNSSGPGNPSSPDGEGGSGGEGGS